jgi:hypothetical protein
MSTSEPKKNEAPASEAVADPGPPEAAGQTAEAGGSESAETSADQAEPAAKTEAKPESAPQAQPTTAPDQASADEPVWPPPESQPAEPPSVGSPAVEAALASLSEEPALLTKPEQASHPDQPSPAAKPDQSLDKPEEPAAEPSQEMGLSESTLHWLVDGEVPIEPSEAHPVLAPIYDPRAPVAGRTRTFTIIGGAAVLALGIAWALHAQAAHHRSATATATTVNNSADLLLHRAEAALAQGHSAEALDLAHLAIVTDSRMADAYIVMGLVQRSGGQMVDARDSYRRYLELAPIGSHAAEARAALTSLPP